MECESLDYGKKSVNILENKKKCVQKVDDKKCKVNEKKRRFND